MNIGKIVETKSEYWKTGEVERRCDGNGIKESLNQSCGK